jgi:hypothetical protein
MRHERGTRHQCLPMPAPVAWSTPIATPAIENDVIPLENGPGFD